MAVHKGTLKVRAEERTVADVETQETQDEFTEHGGDDDDTIEYEIVNVHPLFPGWVACYLVENDVIVAYPIIAIGLVDIRHPDGSTDQVLRHFVSLPSGRIDDIGEVPGFLCVIAPGQDVEKSINEARNQQSSAQQSGS